MSYLVRGETQVLTGRSADYESNADRAYPLFQTSPAFEGAILATSLSRPGRYSTLHRWANFAGYQAFVKSPVWQDATRSMPTGITGPGGRALEAYELIHEVGDPDSADFLYVLDLGIDGTKMAEFESSRLALLTFLQEHESAQTGGRLYRSHGDARNYLMIHGRRGEPHAMVDTPVLARFREANPYQHQIASVSRDTFVVVRRT